MPNTQKVILDDVTGLYCKVYRFDLNSCEWGDGEDAQLFPDQAHADAAIEVWGQVPGERYIGSNPPKPPK